MYLSRLMLDPRHRRVQSELARPFELHRSVLRGFPEQLQADERVLYRLDTEPRNGAPWLIVQSQYAPDWRWTLEQRGYLLAGAAPEVKQFDPRIKEGDLLAFRLRANPTSKHTAPPKLPGDEPRKVRLGILTEEAQCAWLKRKGQMSGFAVVEVRVFQEGMQLGFEPTPAAEGKPRPLTHLAVRYDGLLRVTDPDLLLSAVREGIGSAKGFGFGLLSLARPMR
ncbi:MAG: type I-E CRISPR-associated protein Cas6/Cse3/CasE [Anaerolineae bacterium]